MPTLLTLELYFFWPINNFNYDTHVAPGWWSLGISNPIDIVLNEADLEKDKKPFPLTAGSNQCVDLGHAGAVRLQGSCSALAMKKIKAIPSSWLIQQQEGRSWRLRDRACFRVGKEFPQGLEPPPGGKHLIFSGPQILGQVTLQSNPFTPFIYKLGSHT